MALEKLLYVAQITGRGDGAFDRTHANYRPALLRYARSRLPADLDAIPRIEGRHPRLYGVRVLSPEARAVVADTEGAASRALIAVRVGVADIRHPDNTREQAPVEVRGGDLGSMATAEWPRTLARLGGGALLDELGAVVIARADVGDLDEGDTGPLGPSALPRGAALAL